VRPTRKIPERPAIYARISRDASGESVGVKDQVAQAKAHLTALGWPEPRVYQDNDLSASRRGTRRPGFETLLSDIETGVVDGLAARHLDRLLRRVTDLERVLDAIETRSTAVPVVFVEASEIDLTNASGRLIARILASVAANESEIKSERVRAARRREATSGRPHGRLGYGYDPDGLIVPEEAEVIREVADRVLIGDSLRSIAADLNARLVPTPGDGRWDSRRVAKTVERAERPEVIAVIEMARKSGANAPSAFARLLRSAGADAAWTTARVKDQAWCEHLTDDDHGLDDSTIATVLRTSGVPADRSLWRAANVRAMIRRGALCGWREWSPGERGGSGELVARGDWAPILTRETTDTLRRVTERPGAHGKGRPPRHLLASLLRCITCGATLGGQPDGKGGTRYMCPKRPSAATGKSACTGITIAAAPVEYMVTEAVLNVLASSDLRSGTRGRRTGTPDVASAERELQEVQALRNAYANEAADGDLTLDEYRTIRERLTAREDAARRIIGEWSPRVETVLQRIPTKRPDVERWWSEAPLARKREVLLTLIDHIDIAPSGGLNRFDPSRVKAPVWRV
jgi:DNA invertase Pin-like site-specific DNA recombinase